ncbi:MAG: PilZ domain-containing protein [Lachnospiraceae bacterium]|nr:PilZ domain-containing protein [Lachnospiraceae bacterium]
MRLKDLLISQQIIIQLKFSDQGIEFNSTVIDKASEGIYVSSYAHNGEALTLSIENNSNVQCNLFADDPESGRRISWRNIKVETVKRGGQTLYHLKTGAFNSISRHDDRRDHERITIRRQAQIYDQVNDHYIDIMVYDISDNGISFYAPVSYVPSSGNIRIYYKDSVDDKNYNLKVDCQIARTEKKAGTVFYGCRLLGENRDFLAYGLLKKLRKKYASKEEQEALSD